MTHWATAVNKKASVMNKPLKNYLQRIIKNEYVSVYHDYDGQKTTYSIPYNASLAPRSVRLTLIRALGLDYDDDFDENNPQDIDKMSYNLIADETPLFSLTSDHYINNRGTLMTHYILDFDGQVLTEKSYKSDKLSGKNPLIQLMRKCSDKIIAQEQAAQKYKMEKMFVSTNIFTQNVQHDRM